MWYPEESVTFCDRCDLEIPADNFWRGRGFIITGKGQEERTTVLFSQCPECSQRLSIGLDGPWWFKLLYRWLWQLRYPRTKAPRLRKVAMPIEAPLEAPRRRASGE